MCVYTESVDRIAKSVKTFNFPRFIGVTNIVGRFDG